MVKNSTAVEKVYIVEADAEQNRGKSDFGYTPQKQRVLTEDL